MELNLKDAKRIILHSQGLLQTDQFGRGINAVQKAIEQLGYVQIDTISVVERAHHHTLRTRISNYSPKMLHKLVSDRQTVFEYWSHAAAFLPMQDYRFYQPVMKGFAKKRSIDQKVRQEVVRRIAAEGPLQSRDFENPRGRKSTGWWDWKPTKRAMEHMFLSGELMVRERRGFQKVYDLTENVLPDHIDVSWPTDQEQGHFYVRRMLSGLGIGTAKDIGYARPTVKRLSDNNIQPCIDQSLLEMTESGEITSVECNGTGYYCLTSALNSVPTKIGRKRVSFLSPFDHMVINRKRLLDLFGFDYQIECYVPESKRRFGYFVLPILYGDALVGRLDCKAIRKDRYLTIKNIWLEPDFRLNDLFINAFLNSLLTYTHDLGCDRYVIADANPISFRDILKKQNQQISA